MCRRKNYNPFIQLEYCIDKIALKSKGCTVITRDGRIIQLEPGTFGVYGGVHLLGRDVQNQAVYMTLFEIAKIKGKWWILWSR